MTTRPPVVQEEHLQYLDALRESGAVNMWGASEYVRRDFDVTKQEASAIVGYWMRTFAARHPKGGSEG